MTPTKTIAVEIAPGELIDKITILQIKAEKISDPEKLDNVRRELVLVDAKRRDAMAESDELRRLTSQLRQINEALWETEDEIRRCERNKDFGPRFIELARSVYRQNDHRAAIKRQINVLMGSELVEEKNYVEYDASP